MELLSIEDLVHLFEAGGLVGGEERLDLRTSGWQRVFLLDEEISHRVEEGRNRDLARREKIEAEGSGSEGGPLLWLGSSGVRLTLASLTLEECSLFGVHDVVG